jgi:hypothetical protein
MLGCMRELQPNLNDTDKDLIEKILSAGNIFKRKLFKTEVSGQLLLQTVF